MGALLDAVLLPWVANEADWHTQGFQRAEVLHALGGMDSRVFLAMQDQRGRPDRRHVAYW